MGRSFPSRVRSLAGCLPACLPACHCCCCPSLHPSVMTRAPQCCKPSRSCPSSGLGGGHVQVLPGCSIVKHQAAPMPNPGPAVMMMVLSSAGAVLRPTQHQGRLLDCRHRVKGGDARPEHEEARSVSQGGGVLHVHLYAWVEGGGSVCGLKAFLPCLSSLLLSRHGCRRLQAAYHDLPGGGRARQAR